jgi:hypothetical protein
MLPSGFSFTIIFSLQKLKSERKQCTDVKNSLKQIMSVLNDIIDALTFASARSHAFPVSQLTMIVIVSNITIPVKICSIPGGEWDSFVLCPLNLSLSRLF